MKKTMSKKILSPLRRDGYKAGMIMMLIALSTMLLTTACSSEDDLVNNTANTENTINKGYALPVTVNVTRQGDATTRATFDGSKLNFGEGDKLFVEGPNNGGAGQFAGTLTWQSGETFSGTIYTQNPYSGTADELFSAAAATSIATLLPNGYQSTGFLSINNNSTTAIAYDDEASPYFNGAFVASETAKATGVEQLSFEQASTYSDGFALAPVCAILNFTISGLEAGEKTVTLNVVKGKEYTVTGSVTPNASGVATFAIGVPGGANIKEGSNNLTVGTHNFTLPSSTTFAAGKIYNISRVVNAINGKFTINSSGDQVYFSKGNLRYESGTWSFFEHQYDRYGTYSADAWDLFGWVGTTGTLSSGAELWGASTSNTAAGYGASTSDKLKSDWGNVPGIGSGWRTLSGGGSGEWNYLFNLRSASTVNGTANARFAKAQVNNVQGVILFPDTYTHPGDVTTPTNVNTTNASFDSNTYTVADWAKMEAAGCVFLPTTGTRTGTGVNYVNRGYYWSSTAHNNDERFAYGVHFYSDNLDADDYNGRWWGQSVRLVRDVAAPAPSYTMAAAATAEDIGKVVCAAGHLHPAKTAVPSGCTAVGILGKVTTTGHGLILALKNAATKQKLRTINDWTSVDTYAGTTLKQLPNNTARSPLTSYTTLGSTTVSNWCVAQKSDYEAIFKNLGSINLGEGDYYSNGYTYDDNVNAYITTGVGGTAISDACWSATESVAGSKGWIFGSLGWNPNSTIGTERFLRPVLGF